LLSYLLRFFFPQENLTTSYDDDDDVDLTSHVVFVVGYGGLGGAGGLGGGAGSPVGTGGGKVSSETIFYFTYQLITFYSVEINYFIGVNQFSFY